MFLFISGETSDARWGASEGKGGKKRGQGGKGGDKEGHVREKEGKEARAKERAKAKEKNR